MKKQTHAKIRDIFMIDDEDLNCSFMKNAIATISDIATFIEKNSKLIIDYVEQSPMSNSLYMKIISPSPNDFDYIIRFSDHDCEGRPYGFIYNFIDKKGNFTINKDILKTIIGISKELYEIIKADINNSQ